MLEDTSRYQRKEEVEVEVREAPRFIVPLNGPTELVEGQSAHYECRIEPYPDSSLKVEWYHNNQLLQTGEERTKLYHSFSLLYCDEYPLFYS